MTHNARAEADAGAAQSSCSECACVLAACWVLPRVGAVGGYPSLSLGGVHVPGSLWTPSLFFLVLLTEVLSFTLHLCGPSPHRHTALLETVLKCGQGI